MSLRVRLLLVLLAIYCAGGWFLTREALEQVRPRYLESMEESLVDTAVLLASLLEVDSTAGSVRTDALRDAFRRAGTRSFEARIYSLRKTSVDLRVYVTDAAGIVVFDSAGRDEGRDYSAWNDVKRTLAGAYGARSTYETPDDEDSLVLYVAAPVRVGSRTLGVVSVGKPTRAVNELVAAARRKLVFGAAIGGPAVLFVLLAVASWVIGPIERLTRYARSVRDGRPEPLPPLPGRTLRELGTAFEQMRDALEGRQHVERYTQSMAHELKAPLAAIRGAAELLDEAMPVDQRRKFIGNIRSESARIQQIVERLLELSSLEARKALRRTERIDAGALLADAASAVRMAFDAAGVALEVASEAGVAVRGERVLLREALVNLLQNARDFSPKGGTVVMRAAVDGEAVVFSVADGGPGVPEYALGRVFERFYSLGRPGTGLRSTGLGLTLVREIAHLHGGDASLANLAGGGACAEVRIPRAS